jgi:enamine deaminase RidA (YjgF/YER057c/UK114 family)
MARRLISSGSTFEKSIGYSRAVVDGDWVFVSGTTGFDYSNMTIQDDAVPQCEQALKNIAAALKQADSSFADVVRVHYLMTSASDFERCWPAMGKAFGDVRPACTMMVVGLADPRMKIEIEVTALLKTGRKAAPRKKKAKVAKRKK